MARPLDAIDESRLSRQDFAAAALIAAALLTYYLAAAPALVVLATLVFLAAAWWRLDLAALSVVITAPLYRFPKELGPGFLTPLLGRGDAVEISLAEYCLGVCLVAWVGQGVLRPRAAARRLSGVLSWRGLADSAPLWLPPAAFIGVALLSLPFAEHRGVALREFRVVVLEPSLYYALLVSTVQSPVAVARSLYALVVAGACIALYALWHYVFVGVVEATGGVQRILAVYHSPNALALYLGRVIPIAVALSLPFLGRGSSAPRRWGVAVPVGAAAAMFVALWFTFSRGALLGVVAALVFLGFMRSRRVTLALLAVGALAVVASLPFLPWERFLQAGPITQRFLIWQAAVDMGLDHPLLGVGLDNFLYHYPQYMRPEAADEPDLSHPHNLFLDFWLRLGILGLTAFAALQYHFWRTGARVLKQPLPSITTPARSFALALMACMVDFLIHGLFDNSYFLIDLAFLFWFSYALVVSLDRYQQAALAQQPAA